MNPDPTRAPPAESIEGDRQPGGELPVDKLAGDKLTGDKLVGDKPLAPAPTLDTVLGELRRLAIQALDAGHPLAAAQIATTADRVEAEARRDLPPRPTYPGRR